MKYLVTSAIVGAAMFAAAPVAAQETTLDMPFSGLYIGASGGYDVQPNDVRQGGILFDRNLDGNFNDTVLTGTGANAFAPGFCNGTALNARAPQNGGSCRRDKDGWSYYGRIGFDVQRGNIVVGALGEFGKNEITDGNTAFSSTPANYVFTRDVTWEASARARAGYAIDTTLFYGTAGVGYARIGRDFFSSQSTNTFIGRGDRNQFGFVGGGGIEQKLGRNFSVGMEYTFHQYNDNDYIVRVAGGPATAPFTPFTNPTGGNVQGTDMRRADSQFRWHSLRATAAFRF